MRVRVEVACALGTKIKREVEECVGRGWVLWCLDVGPTCTWEERKSLKVK